MEWSKVSDLQGGLNFPTNFLFARTLSAAGQLYGIPKYTIQAKELAQRMSSLSWDGEVFRDQALETDDGFQPNHEATCYGQYLARLCGVPGATGDNAWWQELVQGGIYGKKAFSGRLHPPNMLFGVLFRWHSLVRAGLLDQFKEEAVEMCDQMAKITGTLWEHTDIRASCNHSCIGYVAAMILHPEKIVDLPG